EPCLFPIQLRLFSYADEDLVFGLTHDNKVMEIRRPEFSVPAQTQEMVDVVYFVRDVASLWMPPR
ncbi:MAG: hypothetical protein MI861_14170, partial [Pirellulales bacterium]|nr:hypothetical protein [Pirellulales bacterium]